MHIRIVSPSGAIDPQYIDSAAARLVSWGHTVSVAEHAKDAWGRFAATDNDRLADLVASLRDDNVDAVLCSRGGYGLQRILPQIAAIPLTKPIIGFSDITALHQLAALAGQPSLHGIMCKHISSLPEGSEVLNMYRKALLSTDLHYCLPSHPLDRKGCVSGVLTGGNLSVLYGLQGTPYGLSNTIGDNAVLFLEDISERHYHIDRMMRNLNMSGVLSRIKGLVVGRFADCDDDPSMKETVYETIMSAVSCYSYPVLFDFPAGHIDDNFPLWFGRRVTLSVDSAHASLDYVC